MEFVGAGFDDEIGCALAAVHHGGTAGFELNLVNGFDGDTEAKGADFALGSSVSDGETFDLDVLGVALGTRDLAGGVVAAGDDAGHKLDEGGGVARGVGHGQRECGVNFVADGLADAGVGGVDGGRGVGDGDGVGGGTDFEGDVEADGAEGVDGYILLEEGLEAVGVNGDGIHAGGERGEDEESGGGGLADDADLGGLVDGDDALDGAGAADLGEEGESECEQAKHCDFV